MRNIDMDALFLDWRQDASYKRIVNYARQFSSGYQKIKPNTEKQNLLDTLFRQAREKKLYCVNNELVQHNIIANAMNEHALLMQSDLHKPSNQFVKTMIEHFTQVAVYLGGGWNRAGFAAVGLVLLSAGGLSYINLQNQASIVDMKLSGDYDITALISAESQALGFMRNATLEQMQFSLGQAFSKVNYVNGSNKNEIKLIYQPQLSALTVDDRLLVTQLLEDPQGQAQAYIKPYLREPDIYLGYWVQNIKFALALKSDPDIRLLMNHHKLLPALEKRLDADHYTKASMMIKANRNKEKNNKEIEHLSQLLLVWLS